MSVKNQKEILGELESQFDANLFVSNGNLSSVSDRGREQLYLTRQDSGVQSRNRKLIQEILKNFDMEKSKRHYETLNVVEYTLDPNNFSYDR
ncbi:hypothetical protein ACJMK2_040330 [Sinanodonta woodiana]|uniref:Uncharacterized protein n=1 Tax=Sinanodonta woodiana TaxID=1069815 RepID=A0ABD3WGL9_SINWO